MRIRQERLRRIIREEIAKLMLDEISSIGVGGGSPVSAGTITGVVTPLGAGPTHPTEPKKRKKEKKEIEKAQKDHRPAYMQKKKK